MSDSFSISDGIAPTKALKARQKGQASVFVLATAACAIICGPEGNFHD